MKRLKPLLLLMACESLLAISCRAQAASDKDSIVRAGWEQLERIELKDGTVQIHARPKAAGVPAVASALPTAKVALATPAAPAPQVDPAAAPAAASGAGKPVDAQFIDSLKKTLAIDLSVPSSPAMTVLGIAGTEVQRPAFPRDFATSLVRGFDSNGKPKNAIAIDIVPVAMFLPSWIEAGEKYQSPLMQIRARTTVSLAAAQVEGNNAASQLAAGIRIGLLDKGDPGIYWREIQGCVSKLIAQMEPVPGPNTAPPPGAAEIVKLADSCKANNLIFDMWAKPALYVGYAQGWYSASAPFKDAARSAKAAWASFSIGLNRRTVQDIENNTNADKLRALLQLYAARKVDARVEAADAGGALVREDRSDFVTRIRFGKEKWHAFVDAGVARVTTGGVASQSVRRIGLGAEYQLREDMWLVVGGVREKGFAAGDRNLINTGLRFGQAAEPQFGLPAGPKKTQ
jgi:hypothetical protein